ncbi:nuclear transport factor 2 family protein [Streptomyces sp. NPDC000229]
MSRTEAARLLHPDFVEVGASGRRWSRDEMLAALPGMAGGDPGEEWYEVSGMTGVPLAPGLVHLTYETVVEARRVRRSSLWRRDPDSGGAWRLYYHQGTPVPEDTPWGAVRRWAEGRRSEEES